MNTYIERSDLPPKGKNAGTKAPKDVSAICQNLGWNKFKMHMGSCGFIRLFILPYQWMKLGKMKSKYILFQYPMYDGTKIAKLMIPAIQKKGSKVVALIHDLESLRYGESDLEVELIGSCSSVICHNHKMKDYLVAKGIEPNKIVELEIFDYLCDEGDDNKQIEPVKNSVAIAGNLSPVKCAYIYKFAESNPTLKIDLYGVGYEENPIYSNVEYHGSFSPEELPLKLKSAYGLVWDGPEITACCGNYGQYLKYNNPHKLSLYMAAGIPVVTWKQAAIADFVQKNQVGVVVESLEDLEEELNQVSDAQYSLMKENAESVGAKLREGYYLRRAIQEIYNRDNMRDEAENLV